MVVFWRVTKGVDQKSSVEKMHHYCGGISRSRNANAAMESRFAEYILTSTTGIGDHLMKEWCMSDLGMKEKLERAHLRDQVGGSRRLNRLKPFSNIPPIGTYYLPNL